MEPQSSKVREWGQFLSVAMASLLVGSIMILSAVGPVHADEVRLFAKPDSQAALRYKA